DFYSLTREQFLELEGFADKSTDQLLAGIAASKQQPLSRLLIAAGIRHVGEEAAKLLARHFGTMDALMAASAEAIEEVRGIGPTIAAPVYEWCQEPWSQQLVHRLAEAGVTLSEPQAAASSGALRGAVVVITGTLPTLGRAEATAVVEEA